MFKYLCKIVSNAYVKSFQILMVLVAKVILMMVGHVFAKESDVKDELDAIVYSVNWDEMLRA